MLKEMLKNHNMPPEEESLELLPLLLRTAVIGFFIGYFIPKWYWEVQHKTYEKEHKSIDRLQEDF